MNKKTIPGQLLAITRFIEALKKGFYIEAHEILEEDWKNYKKTGQKEKAKAIQGLINGATALALYFLKNRPNAYKKVWPVFEKYKHFLDILEEENINEYYQARDLLIKINKTILKK